MGAEVNRSAKFVAIKLPGNIMEYQVATDAVVSSNDQSADMPGNSKSSAI